jgi:molybdopterin/thiamine biosynthesis adenylyltransferase/rhodanese-related sulfurtransferase
MTAPLTPAELARYDRHLLLQEIGVAGQGKLKAARVLIVGAGGLGSPAALYLAAAGVGTLGLIDCDRVDLSNLQRQVLYDTGAVGEPKTEQARARLQALNPDIRVIAHQSELRADNVRALFADYELIIDGGDRVATRYLVNDACVILRKPLIIAAIHRFEGQAMTYVPERGPCYRCLFPHVAEGLAPSCAEAGVLGVLPGVLGTIQATEAIKLIVGIGTPLIGRLLLYDALELRFSELRAARRDDCAVCGSHPSILEPREPLELCSADELERVRGISARALKARLRTATAPLLIDVREPDEFAAGHLPGARNVPLAQLQQRAAEIAPGAEVVFMCRSGARSLRACALAARLGVAPVLQLEGGLQAWTALEAEAVTG